MASLGFSPRSVGALTTPSKSIDQETEKTNNNTSLLEKLPLEVFEMVVNNLDIVTRCHLVQCSKRTKLMISLSQLYINELVGYTKNDENNDHRIHTIKIDSFTKEQIVCDDDEETAEELPTVALIKLFSHGKIVINHMRTNWNFPTMLVGLQNFIKINDVILQGSEPVFHRLWLEKLSKGSQSIALLSRSFNNDEEKDEKIQNLQVFRNAKKLIIDIPIVLSTNSLINLRANHIKCVDVGCGQTPESMNTLIKKWINDDYPAGSTFLLDLQGTKTSCDEKGLMAGLTYTTKTRTSDKIDLVIPMNAKKYIEVTIQNIENEEMNNYWQIQAIIRSKVFVDANTPNWNNLPVSVKSKIVLKMDIFTRTRLKMCSKEDKELVDTTPLYFNKLVIGERTCRDAFGFTLDDELRIDDFMLFNDCGCVTISDKSVFDLKSDHLYKKILKLPIEEIEAMINRVLLSFAGNKLIFVKRVEIHEAVDNWTYYLPVMQNAVEVYTKLDRFDDYYYQVLEHPQLFMDTTFHGSDETENPNFIMQCWTLEECVPVGSYFKTWLRAYPDLQKLFANLKWKSVKKCHEEGNELHNKDIVFIVDVVTGQEGQRVRCTLEMVPIPFYKPKLMITIDVIASDLSEK